jgi:hypothetical protein
VSVQAATHQSEVKFGAETRTNVKKDNIRVQNKTGEDTGNYRAQVREKSELNMNSEETRRRRKKLEGSMVEKETRRMSQRV